jgi:hypothetical protein
MSPNKVLAALLVFVFLVFTLAVILTWSVRANILNADAYVEALEQAGFFEVPYDLIRDGDIPAPGGLLLKKGPLSVISGAELEAVARELAPPEWLRPQMERAVRDLIVVPAAPELDEPPDLTISLREVKERALGEPGDRALAIVLGALPVCAPGRAPLELGRDTPVCRPVDLDLDVFLRRLKSLLALLVDRVPDTYQLSWQPRQEAVLEDLQRAGRNLYRLQFVLLLLAVFNLALLGLIWLLAVRSPAEWLRWTGVPVLLLGLLTMLSALLIPRVVSWSLESTAFWAEAEVSAPLARALEDAVFAYTPMMLRPALFVGSVLTVVGLLLTLVSPFFPGRLQRLPLSTKPMVQR